MTLSFQIKFWRFTNIKSPSYSPIIFRSFSGDSVSDDKRVTMTQVYVDLERQFCEHFANLMQKCTSARLLTEEQKKQKVSEIAEEISEAEALIRKMDVEARSMGSSVKAMLHVKITEYRNDLNKLKTELKRLGSSKCNRAELLGLAGVPAMQGTTDQRGRLTMSNTTVHGMKDNANRSKKIVSKRMK